jgi:hypothetical protein
MLFKEIIAVYSETVFTVMQFYIFSTYIPPTHIWKHSGTFGESSGSHGNQYQDDCLLGCFVMFRVVETDRSFKGASCIHYQSDETRRQTSYFRNSSLV